MPSSSRCCRSSGCIILKYYAPGNVRRAAGSRQRLGAVAAVAFFGLQGDGLGTLHISDLLLIGALVAAAVGYAEGGLLTRELGAWQTISWALVAASPLMVALTAVSVATCENFF